MHYNYFGNTRFVFIIITEYKKNQMIDTINAEYPFMIEKTANYEQKLF